MIRWKYILLALAAGLLLHSGYMYYKVGRDVAREQWEVPSILYGRPTEIRKGDHLGNLRFAERLQRLSYRKVAGKPSAAGTYSEDQTKFRIFLREDGAEKSSRKGGPVEIIVRDGRVASLASPAGAQLSSIRLEPEEIGRIMGPKMESRRLVALSAISPFFQNAVIASEDSRVDSHIGFDIRAIGRAFFANIRNQRFAQGGSTITRAARKELLPFPKEDPLAQTVRAGPRPFYRAAVLEKADPGDVPEQDLLRAGRPPGDLRHRRGSGILFLEAGERTFPRRVCAARGNHPLAEPVLAFKGPKGGKRAAQ